MAEAEALSAEMARLFPDENHAPRPEAASPSSGGPLDAAFRLPAMPGRDARFDVQAQMPRMPQELGLREQAAFQMHFNLMALEIPSIEHCARLILEGGDMPWEFVLDMARQSWDEARHARACYDRLLELGGHVGQYPADTCLWNLSTHQPLANRLAIHQRVGEQLGVDGAIWAAEYYAAARDTTSAALLAFISRDEICHVRFGNKWIRWLLRDEQAVANLDLEARAARQAYTRSEREHGIFPFQRWAHERAGFTATEVDDLERKALAARAPK
jgi:uncharacterized ferritin-like protein (DUF455 family)